MTAENHTAWAKIAVDNQIALMNVFDMYGRLVAGKVEDSIDICCEGGGAAVVNPATKQIADIPVYLCAVRPGSTLNNVSGTLGSGLNRSVGWYSPLVSRGPTDSDWSMALPTALIMAPLGNWWWLPLLGTITMTLI